MFLLHYLLFIDQMKSVFFEFHERLNFSERPFPSYSDIFSYLDSIIYYIYGSF